MSPHTTGSTSFSPILHSNGLEVAIASEGNYFLIVWIVTWDFVGSLTSSHEGICISWWSLQGMCVQKDRKIEQKHQSLVCSLLKFAANHLCWYSLSWIPYWKFIRLLHAVYSIIFDFVFSDNKYAQPSLCIFQHHYSLHSNTCTS